MDLTERLADKVAVITGGASGIGLATAKRMRAEARRSYDGDIDPASGKAVADDSRVSSSPSTSPTRSLSTRCSTPRPRRTVRLKIAFNNAGIITADDDLIENTGTRRVAAVQDINLKSVYLCCKAALRYMVSQQKGTIITHRVVRSGVVGSGASRSATPHRRAACRDVSKLGVQFAGPGIGVNALCPGPVNTPLLQQLFAKDPEKAARRLVHVPLGRFAERTNWPPRWRSASDDASFITASTFLVDGGISSAYVTPL